MFSHIVQCLNLDVKYYSVENDEHSTELSKLLERTRLEYEESKVTYDETNKEIIQKNEQLSIIESQRVKLMSELGQEMQTHNLLKRKVQDLKNIQQSTEFDLNKYNKLKMRTTDSDTLTYTKKKFIIYKHLLKIHFDCYNGGANATTQKGYMFNTITKKLKYFEFNTNGKTDNEISEYLWNKIKWVSDKNWDVLLF